MKTPKVSVILPTYNGSRFIAKSIESVLSQTFDDLELIIIDDGSTDRTAEVAEEFTRKDRRVIFVRNKENLGIQKTLNEGLRLAKGEYIARIDDDDQWVYKKKLTEQVALLDQNPDYVLVGTGVIVVDEERKELFRFSHPKDDDTIRNKMLFKSCFTHSTVMFRKDVVLGIGGYGEDEKVRHVEDYDLWLRLGTVGKLANLPEHGIKFMLREGAISAKYKSEQFRKNVRLVLKYRKNYPRFITAFLFANLRAVLYSVYEYIPFKSVLKPVKKIIFMVYKKY